MRPSEIGVEGDTNEGIKADADPLAVGAGEGIEGRRESDICGHGAIVAPLSHHLPLFTPVLLGGGI